MLVGGGLAAAIGLESAQSSATTEPAEQWAYWRPRMQQIFDTSPGEAHQALRRLAERKDVVAVMTDSDDWLVEESGIATIELVRSVAQSLCPACGYSEPLGCLLSMAPVPRCAACGAILEPGPVVPPADDALQAAHNALSQSGLLLVLGSAMTNATVADLAAGFLARGGQLAIAHETETRFDARAAWRSDDVVGTITALD